MYNSEDIAQQSWLFHSWLEAAPFSEYRGWLIRAYPEGEDWIWDVVAPPDRGSCWFESGHVYRSKSKALLEARRLVNQIAVNEAISSVLESLHQANQISSPEYQALLQSLQCPISLSLA
ncbi:MAG: hypothetical protein B0A82_03520 [Alkalinema sp. CACIAM 70d]|nr:MAG: hypothetical protein B0A82_03520 [Alkalinema sp. CACIAM 70d]